MHILQTILTSGWHDGSGTRLDEERPDLAHPSKFHFRPTNFDWVTIELLTYKEEKCMPALYDFNQNAVLKQYPCTPLRREGRYLWPPSEVDCSSWKIVDGEDTIPRYQTMNVAIDEDMHVFRWSIHRYLARWNPTNKAWLKDILRVQLSPPIPILLHQSRLYQLAQCHLLCPTVWCIFEGFRSNNSGFRMLVPMLSPSSQARLDQAPALRLRTHMDASLTGHRVTLWVWMPDLHSRTGGTKSTRKTSTLTPFTCLDLATWTASNILCQWHHNLDRAPGKSWKKY